MEPRAARGGRSPGRVRGRPLVSLRPSGLLGPALLPLLARLLRSVSPALLTTLARLIALARLTRLGRGRRLRPLVILGRGRRGGLTPGLTVGGLGSRRAAGTCLGGTRDGGTGRAGLVREIGRASCRERV